MLKKNQTCIPGRKRAVLTWKFPGQTWKFAQKESSVHPGEEMWDFNLEVSRPNMEA
jgi:hypothetical protein